VDIRDLLNQPTLAAEPYEVQQYLKRVHKIQEQIEVERQKIHVQSKEKGIDGISLIAFSMQLLMLDFYYDTTKQIQRALEDMIKPSH
jgi:hypothetical protein